MAITESDIELYAARIRAHFAPELRDTAFGLALAIARIVGAKAKDLRPETRLAEIIEWLGSSYVQSNDSLDKVETVMAMEEEIGFVLPDKIAARADTATFADLVQHVAADAGAD